MFEVFFEPETEDEFEFNYVLWQLSGLIVREGYVPQDPSFHGQIEISQEYIESLKERLRNTSYFAAMKPTQQLLDSANSRFNGRMYGYYSGYAHADGLSGAQITQPEPPQIKLSISKFIRGSS